MKNVIGYVVVVDDDKIAWYMEPDYPCRIGQWAESKFLMKESILHDKGVAERLKDSYIKKCKNAVVKRVKLEDC